MVFVDFVWNKTNIKGFGVIAQQVRTIDIDLVDEDDEGYLTINNTLLNMLTTHAVQELSLRESNTNQVASQALQLAEKTYDLAFSNKSEIDLLKEENKKLEKRIEELEGKAA